MKLNLKSTIFLLILNTILVFGQEINHSQVGSKPESKPNALREDFNSYFHKKDSILRLNIGKQYPKFKATSLNRQTIDEKKLVGKVTIINFWFKHCEPCVAEFDELCNLQHKFSKDSAFQFISFTSDSPQDAKESVAKFKLSFPVYPISRAECYRLNLNQGFPTTIIVDKAGKIIFLKSGGYLEKEKIAQYIRKLEQIIEKELNAK